MKAKYKLVLIEWADSGHGYQGWKDLKSLSATSSKCTSVGFLVKESKECKILVPHLDGKPNENNLHGAGDMTIPCSAILKITELSPKR